MALPGSRWRRSRSPIEVLRFLASQEQLHPQPTPDMTFVFMLVAVYPLAMSDVPADPAGRDVKRGCTRAVPHSTFRGFTSFEVSPSLMTDSDGAPLKKTPLHASHVALGARMVPFGGWDMPVEYSGITAEHMAVRTAAGLFDVSHMGEVEIAGKGALEAVQHITSNDASKLQVGQIQYSGLTTPEGTFVDDLLVYRFGPSHYLLVINAGNIDKDYAWIAARAKEAVPDIATVNSSDRYALIAVQGPKAQEILQTLTAIDLPAIKYYWFAHGEIAGVRGTVSRTGYTGEDGFEVMVPPAMAARVWDALLQAGKPHGLIPAGLGARDTLRLEAAMRLLRQRHRRALHRRRSRPRMDRRLEQAGVPRPRRAARAKGRAARRRPWSDSR